MREDRRNRLHPADPDFATAGGISSPARLFLLLRLLAVNGLIGAVVAGALAAVVLINDTPTCASVDLSSRSRDRHRPVLSVSW